MRVSTMIIGFSYYDTWPCSHTLLNWLQLSDMFGGAALSLHDLRTNQLVGVDRSSGDHIRLKFRADYSGGRNGSADFQ